MTPLCSRTCAKKALISDACISSPGAAGGFTLRSMDDEVEVRTEPRGSWYLLERPETKPTPDNLPVSYTSTDSCAKSLYLPIIISSDRRGGRDVSVKWS